MFFINNITVREPNKKREFGKRFKSKMEDILFSLIERLPEQLTPSFVIEWADKYLDRRMAELEREQIKVNWDKTHLEQAVNELRK